MLDFYKTREGRKFFKHDLPNLINTLEHLANSIDTANALKQAEIKSAGFISDITPANIESYFIRHHWTKVNDFPNPKMMVFTSPSNHSFRMAAPADATCVDYQVRCKDLIKNLSSYLNIPESTIISEMLNQ